MSDFRNRSELNGARTGVSKESIVLAGTALLLVAGVLYYLTAANDNFPGGPEGEDPIERWLKRFFNGNNPPPAAG